MSVRAAGDAGLVEAIRARADKGKESVRRDMAQDGRLSMKARGILVYLLSKPDVWKTSAQAIANDCEKDGRDAISSGLTELEKKGYLARKRRKNGRGQWQWAWIYSDDPAEVRMVLDEMFPDGSGAQPDARRGRVRSTKPQVTPINGFPVDGQPVDGSPVDGPAVDGEPGDIDKKEGDNPPTPPRSGGSQVPPAEDGDPPPEQDAPPSRPRCGEHGIAGCRTCGLSVRAVAQAAAVGARRAAEEVARGCPWCVESTVTSGKWLRVDRYRQPVVPPTVCDHSGPSPEDERPQESRPDGVSGRDLARRELAAVRSRRTGGVKV